jgi:hypothetical protein
MPKYVRVDYVDYGVQNEYGWFGKVVVRSDIQGMSDDEISKEISEVKALFGWHLSAIKIEEVPSALPDYAV